MRGKIYVLVALVMVGMVVGKEDRTACPMSCSGHGECEGDPPECRCSDGHTGEDCSIVYMEINRNQVVKGDFVGIRQFRYYRILVNSDQAELEVVLTEQNQASDADLYIRKDRVPDRSHYDDRVISTGITSTLAVARPHGVYFIGVYGFKDSTYDLVALMGTLCEADCSGNGVCADGSCVCQADFFGDGCEVHAPEIAPTVYVSDQVGLREFKYYRIVLSGNTLSLRMEHAEGLDADLYIQAEAPPTLTDFLVRDTSLSTTTSMRLSSLEAGMYFVGVYGYRAEVPFQLQVNTSRSCPNECSGEHGVCRVRTTCGGSGCFSDPRCECAPEYAGIACDTMVVPMQYDVAYPVAVDKYTWNYFPFSTNTGSNVFVKLTQDSPDADCDLFVRLNDPPTLYLWDEHNSGFDQTSTVVLESPGRGTWHVGVYGFTDCTASLSVTIGTGCLNDCSGGDHGVCQEGVCRCNAGWGGEDCSLVVRTLAVGQSEQATLTSELLYVVEAVKDMPLHVVLREPASTMAVNLFAAEGNTVPSPDNNDAADTHRAELHSLTLVPERDGPVTILVTFDPEATSHQVPFHIVHWQALL